MSSQTVYTELGKGIVVFTFKDGTMGVELEHGGGVVLRADQMFGPGCDSPGSEIQWETEDTSPAYGVCIELLIPKDYKPRRIGVLSA